MAAVTKIEGLGGDGDTATSDLGPVMHEVVYNRLREALIAGRLPPGRALSVRGLAAEFDVSAMPAREAIRRLAALGALEFTDTRRVMIAKMTGEKLGEIKDARLALEPILAERAAIAMSEQARAKRQLLTQLERIDSDLDGAIRGGDADDYSKFNSEFHFSLYKAANASVLLGMVEGLWMRFGPFMRVVIGRLGTSCLMDDHHKKIVHALEENDIPALKAAVHNDILQGMDNIRVADFSAAP